MAQVPTSKASWEVYLPKNLPAPTSSASQMAIGGGRWMIFGGTSVRQGNKPTQWPHALLQMVQDCLAWVNVDTWEDWCGTIPPTYEEWEAEGWGGHGTSIVNHCLYFELGRLEEVESLASPSNSTCPLPQGKRNQWK